MERKDLSKAGSHAFGEQLFIITLFCDISKMISYILACNILKIVSQVIHSVDSSMQELGMSA